MQDPKVILLVSGKRKSGKDFICEKLKTKLGENICSIIRISGPLKGLYASLHKLDLLELMSDSPYKEKHRLNMIKWSEGERDKDNGYFCRAACAEATVTPVWIVSDIRRKSDIEWFKETYRGITKTVRISADLDTRKNRGWKFTKDVDDAPSECDLDDFNAWDIMLDNNNTQQLETAIITVLEFLHIYTNNV
ncbi:unnamed protein product [Phaedon cochleariae]|uniref:Phosphomevalonate kinase n=1 Tax=Phaedon cochleariae TaxID=80249 RepID=A0A9N9SGU3_PHACE|nr:unnamed protein product [Phaedon cochleariae]